MSDEAAGANTHGPQLAAFRRLSDFGGIDGLSSAERQLLEHCRIGKACVLVPVTPGAGSSRWPAQRDEQNRVRAEFLRFLALGGYDRAPVHERGVLLDGAWIDGELNLYGTQVTHQIELKRCRLQKVVASWASLRAFELFECRLEEGFEADGMQCEGGLFLRAGTHVTGEVRLIGAKITGGLYCEGGIFANPGGDAVACQEATITGRVGFNGYLQSEEERQAGAEATLPFKATGVVTLASATIGTDLDCSGASFDNPTGDSLIAEGARVAGAFFFRTIAAVTGYVNLWNMRVGALTDDFASWDKARGRLVLDGFAYGTMVDPEWTVGGPAGAAVPFEDLRIRWLRMQRTEDWQSGFRPQPWEQLTKALREMGYADAARRVAIAKERCRDNVVRSTPARWPRRCFRWWYGLATGYGYAPERLAVAVLAMLAMSTLAYAWAVDPCARPACAAQAYLVPAKAAKDAPPAAARPLDPLFYSIDVLLPVDLGYVGEWRPGEGWGGAAMRYLIGIETVFGYIVVGLLLASLGKNVIRHD